MARTAYRKLAPRRAAAAVRLPHPTWRLDPAVPDGRAEPSLRPGEFWERLGM